MAVHPSLRLLAVTLAAFVLAAGWPEWKPGTEFKARREEMLRK